MSNMPEKLNVLFVCTGNTCRSQMAEGLLRERAGEYINVYSAGSDPDASVNRYAITVMREIGIDISGQRPKSINGFIDTMTLHYVITLCDSAAKECPDVWQGALNRLHLSVEDPASFCGKNDKEMLAKYREVRDIIAARIDGWLADKQWAL